MNSYALAHIVHVFCAITFVGGVFFEALVLSVLHSKRLSSETRREVERAISQRARQVMPFVVLGVFVSGGVMAARYGEVLRDPFASSFGTQLLLKLCLAGSVLVHFVIAVSKMKRGTLTVAWSKYIHAAVLCQMVGIVLLAKTMFYVSW
ncbi:CopD family copper resistance protein [Alysiella filiformis]|uniref:Copper resistance protein D n=1 Tax=Alysiella filiformis DSM 16848 TaxID=1120981 RepID=A0A286E954_9NEIS|nr:hypothetical protein [Alysiella filiformis]QMT31450.1 hypothetical protein H3L97_00605 [Alysiella filiformis]UBQ55538.1 hypothetical protein JF568_08070 [Alysiella filiformis DSM 16848]SOD67432.1 hypothetical protein SAMN02746062_00902 [Alysiella filiformis DSM 16848]